MIIPSERLKRAIRLQVIALILSAALVIFTAILLVNLSLPSSEADEVGIIFLRFLLMSLAFVVIWRFLGWPIYFFLLQLIILYIYKGDAASAIKEAEEYEARLQAYLAQNASNEPLIRGLGNDLSPWGQINKIMFNVKNRPNAPIARFMDADIYEWLDIKLPGGQVFRATFDGIVNLQQDLPKQLPPNCVLLPPGILYRLEPHPEARSN